MQTARQLELAFIPHAASSPQPPRKNAAVRIPKQKSPAPAAVPQPKRAAQPAPKPATKARPAPKKQAEAQQQPVAAPPAAQGQIIPPGYWSDLCTYLTPGQARPAVALVGPAGNGKTTAAEAACEALGYAYIVIDATEYLEPADLVGCMTYDPAQGEVWRDGPITTAFRTGKAIIINEFDSLNPRAALCLQSATQDPGLLRKSRYITTPGGPEDRVYPSGDCPILVTMNTYGNGATRQYVGRNALDAATADRFTILTTGYENEASILAARGYAAATADRLAAWAAAMREKIEENALRIVLSLRTLLRMAQAIEAYGQSFETAVEKEFLGRLEPDTRALLS